MQLLVRGGAPTRTVTVCCEPSEDVASIKAALGCSSLHLGHVADMVLLHAGHVLADDRLISTCQLSHGDTLHVSSRLRGGGGDGGSTGAESRSCYLEMYQGKKPDKVNPAEELLARWTRCHLSGADLSPPCVVDELGTLYNKETLLNALLNKTLPTFLSYITGLKSVTEMKLTPHDAAGSRDKPKVAVRGMHQPGNEVAFCCPITGLEFNGRFKFQVHRPTGITVSDKAIKEVPQVVAEMVGGAYKQEEWIPVNPAGDQLEALKVAQAAKMAAEREKKAKRAAAKLAAATGGAAGAAATAGAAGAAANGTSSAQLETRGSPPARAAAAAETAKNGQKRGSDVLWTAPAAEVAAGGVAKAAADAAKRVKGSGQGSVYASLFTSSIKNPVAETYCCRSTSARGQNMS